METRRWIKQAEKAGWRVKRVSALSLELGCSCVGCAGSMTLPLENLGDPPGPCSLPHQGAFAQQTFDEYVTIVGELQRRRRQLGLDQGDVNEAMGAADGYISKLEALHRTAPFPTLQLWAQTLGLSITVAPAALPPATIKAIEDRKARPYEPQKARFKQEILGL